MLLADSALYAGRGAVARQAYQRLRDRFGGGAEAALAAFRLGRLDFDGASYAGAVGWFQIYLREAPGGALARAVRGNPGLRVMIAADRGIPYGTVVGVIDTAKKAGVTRVGLATER